mmetsp:Transcript_55223/g.115522  ORF Transcript_55223/g.115522 Transcript_55223/m.115522 type:complete len:216 (+) Transcript_55223:153-800(+)
MAAQQVPWAVGPTARRRCRVSRRGGEHTHTGLGASGRGPCVIGPGDWSPYEGARAAERFREKLVPRCRVPPCSCARAECAGGGAAGGSEERVGRDEVVRLGAHEVRHVPGLPALGAAPPPEAEEALEGVHETPALRLARPLPELLAPGLLRVHRVRPGAGGVVPGLLGEANDLGGPALARVELGPEEVVAEDVLVPVPPLLVVPQLLRRQLLHLV